MPHPFALTFRLKQHTPLLHFQHDQDGATLRASEVKPRFDQYLIKQLYLQQAGISLPEWVIPNEKGDWSLDYRLTIKEQPGTKLQKRLFLVEQIKKNGDKEVWETHPYPTVLSNMGGKPSKSDLKQLVFYGNSSGSEFEAYFFCVHQELKQAIATYFPDFLYSYNFGNRQTKGFGSFTVADAVNLEQLQRKRNTYWFQIDVSHGESEKQKHRTLFTHIDYLHRILRGGVNSLKIYKGQDQKTITERFYYFKSLLFMYCQYKLNPKVQWDKKSMKEEFLASDLRRQINDHKHPVIFEHRGEKFLVRDMLGLSSKEKWGKHELTKKDIIDEVDRYKSPILYKPIRINEDTFAVEIILEEDNTSMLDREFELIMKYSWPNAKDKSFSLKTMPSFSLNDYFRYAFLKKKAETPSVYEIDINKHIQVTDPSRAKEFLTILNHIFNEIRTNYKP